MAEKDANNQVNQGSQNKKKADTRQKRRAGLYTVLSGIGMLAIGYLCLAKGSITVAPALIVGAFVVMAVGIVVGWD